MKSFDQLMFTDNYMFACVLYNKPDLCKELLELLLNRKIDRIQIPQYEKSVSICHDTKGVRFDVFTQDDDAAYDIEMQVVSEPFLARRSRYYHDMIDMDILSVGQSYQELKDSYVIFICLNSRLEICSRPIQVFRSISEDEPGIELGDGRYTVILNAGADLSQTTPALRELLTYIRTGELSSEQDRLADQSNLVMRIDREVRLIKSEEFRRLEYMTLEEMLSRERKEGVEKGRQKLVVELIEDMEITISQGASRLGISEEDMKRLLLSDEKYTIE